MPKNSSANQALFSQKLLRLIALAGMFGLLTACDVAPVLDGTATLSANHDSASTQQTSAVNINVLANDTGLDDVPLVISIEQAVINGFTVVEANNTITYTPNSTYDGIDTFTYRVTDKDGDTATATVSVTVSEVDRTVATLSANHDSVSTDQGTPINISVLANDTGLDDVPLLLSIEQVAIKGSTIIEANNTITYTPNGTYAGLDTFTYRVTDKDGDTATATVSVTVSAVGGTITAIPSANNDSVSTDQGTSININVLANDTGLDDAPLEVSIEQVATNGSIFVEANNTITYTPSGTYAGLDTFIYRIKDKDGDTATATVSVTVSGVGGVATPAANNDSVSTDQVTPININVLANDTGLDDAPLVVSIEQVATKGSINVEANNTITYTPNGTYAGLDTFTYRVTDKDGDIATATVSVTVSAVGGVASPAANNDSVSTDQVTPINISVLANDTGLDDAPLVVSIEQVATKGSTNVEANNTITYTPNGTYAGLDTFTYRVTDKDGDIATATVSVTVSAVGGVASPAANNDSVSTDQVTPINISVLANDTGLDDAPLVVSIEQVATKGSTNVEANNTITYTPNGTYVGLDTFTYRVTDKDGDTATATVSVTVGITLEVSEPSLSNYKWSTLTVPSRVYIDRLYTYFSIPSAYLGIQSLQTANDDKGKSGSEFLSFTVNKTVDVYVGHADNDTERSGWLSTWEWTGDTLGTTDRTLYLYKKVFASGTVTLPSNASSVYGSMYVVLIEGNDDEPGSGIAIPSVNDDSASTNQVAPTNINVLANDTGLDDAPLAVSIEQVATNGSTTVEADNTITYTPNGTYVGLDTFIYRVTDKDGDTAIATVSVTVSASGTAIPSANNDSVSTDQGTPININVLANDTGLDDVPLMVAIVQAAVGGTTAIESNNTITYAPNGTFAGTDMFIYSVTDANDDIATATVNLSVSCETCANVNVTFSWNANSVSDYVLGYRVYTGTTLDTATTEISNLVVGSSGFDAAAPSITYDAWNELGLSKGDALCFRLKAYNGVGISDFSTGVCDVIPN